MWALPKLLSKYVDYYNRTRTHLSLTKNPPEHRTVQRPTEGRLVEVPRVRDRMCRDDQCVPLPSTAVALAASTWKRSGAAWAIPYHTAIVLAQMR
jgi:hypothetical protein